MATVDFSNATKAVSMTDSKLVGFGSIEAMTATNWDFLSTGGHDIHMQGQDMTFDAAGHAQSGVVTSISFDLDNKNFTLPDITITGLTVDAGVLDDGPNGFWAFLEGDDVIIGPRKAISGGYPEATLFGDGPEARSGLAKGGNDIWDPLESTCRHASLSIL